MVTDKKYDYLDHRNDAFDEDFDNFISSTNFLKESIAKAIEDNYSVVWDNAPGIKFIPRFEKVLIFVLLFENYCYSSKTKFH